MEKKELVPVSSWMLEEEVRKPTALVHYCRTLSPRARRLLPLLVYLVQNFERVEGGLYFCDIKVARAFIGDTGKNYKQFYDSVDKLSDKKIKWNIMSADRTIHPITANFIITKLLPDRDHDENMGVGRWSRHFGFEIHPRIEKIIKNPTVFARIKIIMAAILSHSKYGFDLYELFTDYMSRKGLDKCVYIVPLQELKEDYLGFGEDEYMIYKNFKKYILKPNIEAINSYSDLRVVSFVLDRKQKKRNLVFHLEKKDSWDPPLFVELEKAMKQLFESQRKGTAFLKNARSMSPKETEIITKLRVFVADKISIEAIEKHGLNAVEEVYKKIVSDVERRKGTENPIENPGGYAFRCLEKGHGKKTEADRFLEQKKVVQRKEAQEEAARKEQEQKEVELKQLFDIEARDEAVKIYRGMSPVDRKEIFETILSQATFPMDKIIKEQKEEALRFKMQVREMLKDQFPAELQNFDAWKKAREHKGA